LGYASGVHAQLRVVAIAPVLNEERKIGEVCRRTPRDVVDELIVVDDGSTDRSATVAASGGATVLALPEKVGVGAALRIGYQYAIDKEFDVAVVMAGNNKDAPEEIPRLLEPIASGQADLVQGSRYLESNADLGAMPTYRRIATRVHPMLFSVVAGQRMTDSTNGFRAIRVSALLDPRLDISSPGLDEYELEPYLLLRAIKSGYRVREVPVTKLYPQRQLGQTKMKPLTGWWSMLRPLAYGAIATAPRARTARRAS